MSTQDSSQQAGSNKSRGAQRIKKLRYRLFGSPQYERLKNALDEYEIKLHCRLDRQPFVSMSPWAKAAKACLERARKALAEKRYDSGWQNLKTAQSLEIWVFTEDEVRTARQVKLQETVKLSGWRKKTVESLLCGREESSPQKDPASSNNSELQRRELYQATLILNEQYNNLYHKIRVRERSLKIAFLILTLILFGAPLTARLFWNQATWKMLAAVELCGVLGAALSVASSLTRSTVDMDIPQQKLALVVTWMRPAIGAGAALASYLFLKANLAPAVLEPSSLASALVIAFVAGFSERFITGAVENIVPDKK